MEKDFDAWNDKKKGIDSTEKQIEFHEREIWWCSIGINVGHEQDAENENFSRPILVVRRFTPDIFWGTPLTTQIRHARFRLLFTLRGVRDELLLSQMRTYDRKRLLRKIGTMPKESFLELIREIKSLL